jgi:hypothetical protein
MKIKNIKLLLTGTALAALGALSLQACSSSDDSSGSAGSGGTATGGASSGGKGGTSTTGGTSSAGKGGTGTGGTGTTTGGTGTGGTGIGNAGTGAGAEGGVPGGDMGGDTGSAGAAAELHPSAAECTDFCTLDGTTCMGTNQPYASPAECQTDCLAYALGDDSDPTRMVAKTGDNFACRAYHLENAVKNAAVPANLTLHCGHTGLVSTACFNP